jgi:hypothetical protein
MTDIIARFEALRNKKLPPYFSGSIYNVFYLYEKMAKNEDGSLPICIKLEPEEKKKKKSIN